MVDCFTILYSETVNHIVYIGETAELIFLNFIAAFLGFISFITLFEIGVWDPARN